MLIRITILCFIILFFFVNASASELPSIETDHGAEYPYLISVNAFSLGINTINSIIDNGNSVIGAFGLTVGFASLLYLLNEDNSGTFTFGTAAINTLVSTVNFGLGLFNRNHRSNTQADDNTFGFCFGSRNELGMSILINF